MAKIGFLGLHTFENIGGFELVIKDFSKYSGDVLFFNVVTNEEKFLTNEDLPFRLVETSMNSKLFSLLLKLTIPFSLNSYFVKNIKSKLDISLYSKVDVVIVTDPQLLYALRVFLQENELVNIKIFYWDHGSLPFYYSSPLRWFVYKKNIMNGLRSVDGLISISSGLHNFYSYHFPNVPKRLVYNPFINNSKPFDKKVDFKKPLKTLCYVGRLEDAQKNLKFLIKALKYISFDGVLNIYGAGKDISLLRSDGSFSIVIHGFTDNPIEQAILDGCQAILLTSRYEGLPLVLIEAASRELPILAADCFSGPSDIVFSGINGYLYTPDSLEDFMRAFIDLENFYGSGGGNYKKIDLSRFEKRRVFNNIIQFIE